MNPVDHDASVGFGVGPPDATNAPILASAREVYQTYCQAHVNSLEEPLGVAVDQRTLRSQLIFSDQPILLPHEFFIAVADLMAAEGDGAEMTDEHAAAPETMTSDFQYSAMA